MSQSRKGSAIETAANITVGWVVSYILNYILLPHYGVAVSFWDNFEIVSVFTVASIIRSYSMRRFFNAWRTI